MWQTFGAAAMTAMTACAHEPPLDIVGTTPPAAIAPSAVVSAAPLPARPPQVELREPNVAQVAGERIGFDGISEALAWPALAKALGRGDGGAPSTVVSAGRDVPMRDLLRAAWTLRSGDIWLQTDDEKGALYVVDLKAKQERVPDASHTCHLAVFVKPDGSLRVATPAGPQEIGGERAADSFAQALATARIACPIRYVAFGAESNDVPWGRVFDVIVAVDRIKAAGDARYVLGEAL